MSEVQESTSVEKVAGSGEGNVGKPEKRQRVLSGIQPTADSYHLGN